MGELDGIWLVRAGVFGEPDSQIRGGTVVIEDGRVIGGDDVLVYVGECRLDDTKITGSIHVVRHGDPEHRTFFGSQDSEYTVEFVTERLHADYYEGRLTVGPGIEGRMFMCRLGDLPPRKLN